MKDMYIGKPDDFVKGVDFESFCKFVIAELRRISNEIRRLRGMSDKSEDQYINDVRESIRHLKMRD